MIPWDSDVDMGVLTTDVGAVVSLASEIKRAGFQLDTSDPYVLRIKLSAVNTQHVDIFPWNDHRGMLSMTYYDGCDWPGMTGQEAFPADFIEHLEPVGLEGCELPAPSPVERFLAEHRYGPGFRTPSRPVLDATLYPDIRPAELTPVLLSLFEAVAWKESELAALERRTAGRLAGMPSCHRWLRSGMPVIPAPERIAHLRGAWTRGETGALVEQLLESLARLHQAVDELASPSARTRAARVTRRGGKLVGR